MHFGPPKKLLGSRRFYNNQEMLSAVHKRFLTRRPDVFRDGIFKLAPRRDKFIGVAGDYIEKQTGYDKRHNVFLFNFYDLRNSLKTLRIYLFAETCASLADDELLWCHNPPPTKKNLKTQTHISQLIFHFR